MKNESDGAVRSITGVRQKTSFHKKLTQAPVTAATLLDIKLAVTVTLTTADGRVIANSLTLVARPA